VILRSTPVEGGIAGGVYSGAEKMNRADWRDSKTRTTNWMMDGTARYRLGMGGRPSERELREMKTKDWSVESVD
jgi:hypothetical protein